MCPTKGNSAVRKGMGVQTMQVGKDVGGTMTLVWSSITTGSYYL